MKVKIDPDLCTACGLCTDGVPQVFKMGKDTAEVITPEVRPISKRPCGTRRATARRKPSSSSRRNAATRCAREKPGAAGLFIAGDAQRRIHSATGSRAVRPALPRAVSR